ncbi:putative nucleic acid-binding protein, contains PIN domain [Archaeoglobus sulfaticallidus PM70-1]|uniref:Putative nucleic acid-binding protein, contains PIN domain n=1 Tax=Archaeoglobus sulfaticallidus PM70-1 TaxID=387631 RepID=N0BF12_9EURY|nr:DUF3368 domain-containing protein [Archaeoglobus sulfaticallidus]AGK62249.1 putative nucleic acid-binding protein, contains PIN domain [Archaeoglobus sulfaticallidus PM70-1]
MIVFNSTPLIYLSKVNLSWIFEELEGKKLIPKSVYFEVVVKGKERGDIDAFIVEDLIKKGVIKVIDVEVEGLLRDMKELHKGEIEALELAREKDGIAIIDDSIAREIGEILGIKVHGSLYLVFLMLKKGKIDKKTAKSKVEEMIRKGFRLSAEVYSEFLRLLDSEWHG